MPNLINTDNAGNTFYNYITPMVKGGLYVDGNFNTGMSALLTEKLGASGGLWDSAASYRFILPAPGLETRTSPVSSTNYRFQWDAGVHLAFVNSNNTASGVNLVGQYVGLGESTANRYVFSVVNDYAFVFAAFNSTFTSAYFSYLGWARENTYSGSTATRSLIAIRTGGSYRVFSRPTTENSTSATTLSTAADSITSPPIVCTAGTDPGDDSETATDIVIRDAASPYNPVGKLWNCIDLPATCNVGDIVKNTGTHDGDGSTSEQDVYLCVMPWGTRKLGMRVWTEGVT